MRLELFLEPVLVIDNKIWPDPPGRIGLFPCFFAYPSGPQGSSIVALLPPPPAPSTGKEES